MREQFTISLLVGGLICVAAPAALIELGNERTLLLDGWLIESSQHVSYVPHRAKKAVVNPVIQRDRSWEGNSLNPLYAYYDAETKEFRLWYRSMTVVSTPSGSTEPQEENPAGGNPHRPSHRFRIQYDRGDVFTCYATSKDGLNWTKPALGLFEYAGSKANNIVPPDHAPPGLLLYDPEEPDPAKRFKAMRRGQVRDPEVVERLYENPGEYYFRMSDEAITNLKAKNNWGSIVWNLSYSPDGFTWTSAEENPVIQDPPHARTMAGPTIFMWDPLRKTYAVHTESTQHTRSLLMRRNIGRAESPDMIQWSFPELILVPDPDDPPDTEFYVFHPNVYAGLYLGLLSIYRTNSGEIYPQFTFSRDGIRYHRQYRQPFIELGNPSAFDALEVYARNLITVGDTHYVFYHGRVAGHDQGIAYERAWTAEDTYSGVGLATLPLDRFVGVEAAVTPGEVVTRTFTFSGNRLKVNMDGGPLRVQVLGPSRHLVQGYTLEDADPLTGNFIGRTVTWNGESDLSHLEGKTIKLRFQMNNCKLYSFWFESTLE